MGLEVASEDVCNRPDKADFVLESLWLAHGDTLLTVTDIVRIILCLDPSGNALYLADRTIRLSIVLG
jgi:hypothetical protein